MFANWSGWHTVKTILGITITAASAVAASNQGVEIGDIASIVSTIAGSLVTIVVVLSGSTLGGRK